MDVRPFLAAAPARARFREYILPVLDEIRTRSSD
jgi:hypothetical protein